MGGAGQEAALWGTARDMGVLSTESETGKVMRGGGRGIVMARSRGVWRG